MTDKSQGAQEAITAMAHQWRARLSDSTLTPAERQAFEEWMASDSRHRAAYEKAQNFWGALADVSYVDVHDKPIAEERIIARLGVLVDRGRDLLVRPSLAFGTAAASLAGIIVLTLLVSGMLPTTPDGPTTQTFMTGTSEVREITLSDGTQVTLGASSQIRVQMGDESRRVELRSGDAYFDVAKVPAWPFVVSAQPAEISVLGTAFEVQTDSGGIQVAVEEGRVGVVPSADLQSSNRISPSETSPHLTAAAVELEPGQTVRVTVDDGLSDVASIDKASLGAWRFGQLVYVRASLSEVVQDANRYSDRLYIAAGDVRDLKLSGTFNSSDIDGMMRTIAQALPIDIVDQGSMGVFLQKAP